MTNCQFYCDEDMHRIERTRFTTQILHPLWLMVLLLKDFQHFHDLHFYFQLFLNSNDLNAGLYDGEVTGRRRFGDSQVMHDMDG